MGDALVGHTGFVGGILARQHAFAALFNSRTIDAAAGQGFGTLVCAAAPGSMFEANRFPERDTARIEALMAQLGRLRAERFVLISSIAVLADFAGGDDEGSDRLQYELAYGRNRARLEAFCAEAFPGALVLRLPALFGPGLKKNFLFDILNPMPSLLTAERLEALRAALPAPLARGLAGIYAEDPATGLFAIDRAALEAGGRRRDYDAAVAAAGLSALGFTHPDSRFQYYDMSGLWADIGRGLAAGLGLLHLATEPVAAGEIHRRLTGRAMPAGQARLHREDMHTRHAALWGRQGPYIADAAEVLDGIAAFFARQARVAA